MVSIMDFPNEIFLTIFEIVCELSIEEEQEQHDPALFPFALAQVCRRWLDILAMIPEYWRRIMLPLESPALSPSVLQTYFGASASAGIYFNLRVSYCQSIIMDSQHENERVAMIANALLPYLDRCYALYFTLLYRSSTIVASRIFDGASAPNLTVICVESFVADTQESLQLRSFRCPSVNKVSLDAKSFIDFIHASKTWEEWNSSAIPVQADFMRYRPPSHVPGLSPTALAEVLFILNDARGSGFVSFTDIKFDCSAPLNERVLTNAVPPSYLAAKSDSTDPATGKPRLLDKFSGILIFQHIDGPYISTHFPWRNLPNASVSINDCAIPAPLPWFDGYQLSLQQIESTEEIVNALQNFHGCALRVDKCAGFTDEVIMRMLPVVVATGGVSPGPGSGSDTSGNGATGTTLAEVADEDQRPAPVQSAFGGPVAGPNVETLTIVMCTDTYTMGALRQMVQARLELDHPLVAPIDLMDVHAAPELSEEDGAWLRGHVQFGYSTPAQWEVTNAR